jgi:hypothetical protein
VKLISPILPLATLLFLVTSGVAHAQIGYAPEDSPFRDFEETQVLSLTGGYLWAPNVPGNVNPHSAPMAGLRYDLHVFGPAYFEARWMHAFSTRDVINPLNPPYARLLQSGKSSPLNLIDVGMALNLTGQRTTHSLVPVIDLDAGLATDLGAPHDSSGFRFGNAIELSGGFGLRYLPSWTKLKFRLDLTDYLYDTKLPDSYRTSVDGSSVVTPSQSLTAWRQNIAVTLGVSLPFLK